MKRLTRSARSFAIWDAKQCHTFWLHTGRHMTTACKTFLAGNVFIWEGTTRDGMKARVTLKLNGALLTCERI